jgi:hypothetical protein
VHVKDGRDIDKPSNKTRANSYVHLSHICTSGVLPDPTLNFGMAVIVSKLSQMCSVRPHIDYYVGWIGLQGKKGRGLKDTGTVKNAGDRCTEDMRTVGRRRQAVLTR